MIGRVRSALTYLMCPEFIPTSLQPSFTKTFLRSLIETLPVFSVMPMQNSIQVKRQETV